MNKYALLDVSHEDYTSIIEDQTQEFETKEGHTNYVPILNLDGTQALIKLYKELQESECILNNNFDPDTRNMSEWEEEIL